jgi:HlyD family secretion protein
MTKKRKRLLAIIGLVVVGLVAAGALLSNRPQQTLVQTGKVERLPLLESIVSASGEIRAKDFVDLQTEIAGVIIELPVKEGDRVEPGQVLLRIDPFQAGTDVASARAQFEASCAERTVSESNRDLLKDQLDRRAVLHAQDLITDDEYKAADSALRVAESQVAAAEKRCAVAQSNLERMEDMLNKTTIASPLGGVITKLNVSKGERAVPGILSNPEATLMTIADLSTIEAEVKVDETDIILVSLGDRAVVTVDALPDAELEGHVTEIGNSPIGDTGELRASSTNQEGKDFKVVVRIDAPPASLRPGLTANAEIYVESRDNVLVIPLQAVTMREVRVDADGKYVPPDPAELERVQRGEAGDTNAQAAAAAKDAPKEELEGVFLRDGERAKFRPVKLGIKGEAEVEVVEGLAEGEELVTGSYKVLRTLKEWDLIEVEPGAKSTLVRSKTGHRR